MTTPAEVADQFLSEAAELGREIAEIEMLVAQATSEAGRHEARRAAAADKLASLDPTSPAGEALEIAAQVVTLTRRAALMDAQLEILESKKRAAGRLQETIRSAAETVRALDWDGGASVETALSTEAPVGPDDGAVAAAVSRLVLSAQEELRREIARAMHDGPAQSLTNIVLQAEIVERLVTRDPKLAAVEVRGLVAMVQQTLEATKTFIFDVRPMVLDDLGLVPTLRRSTRDRGSRAGVKVDFASVGVDRRLGVEMETGLFRIADEALAAYLAAKPARASLAIDWGDSLVIEIKAEPRTRTASVPEVADEGNVSSPTLSAMVADRRAQHSAAVERARIEALVNLPAPVLRDLTQRAATLGIEFEVLGDGAGLRLGIRLTAAEIGAAS